MVVCSICEEIFEPVYSGLVHICPKCKERIKGARHER